MAAPTLALEYLFQRLQAETLERRPPTPPNLTPPISCVFGWREPSKQTNTGPGGAARVVLQPGDPSGKIGSLEGAKLPGRNPAPVATLVELATLYLWAVDPTDRTELGQYRAARRLHDLVVPIVIRSFRGRWKQLDATWVRPELEQRFGAELAIVIAVEAMIPDDVTPEVAGGTVTTVDGTIASLSGSGVPQPCG
jgi:hypothetical protein